MASIQEVKLCLLGESGVGKSSIAQRYVHDNFRPAQESTIGASFLTKTLHVDNHGFKFQIWDTAGQEKYRALAPMYYRGAAAAIVTYDITRDDTFDTLKSWISELRKHGPVNIVMAVAGNKCDLTELRQVQYKDALNYAESVGAVFVETSAKTGVNVNALFHEISKRLIALGNQENGTDTLNSASGTIQLQNSGKDSNSGGGKRKCCSS